MIIAHQLPQSGIDITDIDPGVVFPFHAVAGTETPFYVHTDGSLVAFFTIESIEPEFIGVLIDNLPRKASLQIFKLKIDFQYLFYGCAKIPLDYSDLKLTTAGTVKRIIKGVDDLLDYIARLSNTWSFLFKQLISRQGVIVPIMDNDLYRFLIDCSMHDHVLVSNIVPRANVSVMLTGSNRCSGLFSLNDFSNIGLSTANSLREFPSYLQILALCRPSSAHSEYMEGHFSRITNLISHLSPADVDENGLDARVHSMSSTLARRMLVDIKKGLFFISSTFMFNAGSIRELDSIADSFAETLHAKSIVPYMHTNSAHVQYASCFPGNADTGYHYHLSYYTFIKLLVHGYFAL